jgi:prepilin-type N-terminal cleavage/methylation domain-containing protein
MITKTGVRYRTRTRGFTLTEAMLAVTVLGFAAAGVLLPFVSGAAVRAEGMRRTLGAGLAGDLMEQILRLPFHDPQGTNYSPGPEGGDFDNVDDFHGYAELQGQVKDAAGVVFTDPKYANYSRNVTCVYATVSPQPAQTDPAKCNFILVTVQVNCSGKNVATLCRLVSE